MQKIVPFLCAMLQMTKIDMQALREAYDAA